MNGYIQGSRSRSVLLHGSDCESRICCIILSCIFLDQTLILDFHAMNKIETPPSDLTIGVTRGRDYHIFEFTGSGGEYFGIWIVNLILSVVTLGIYSAWAKVRRVSYFNNNTRLNGYGFGYHATGRQILMGRLLAVAMLAIYSLISYFAPLFSIVLTLAFTLALPFLWNASLRFTARMTSYRNVRFDWHGTYWKSLFFLIVGPALGILSLGILVPLFSKHYYRYLATHHSYGATRFEADPSTKSFYLEFLWCAFITAVGFIVLFIAASGSVSDFTLDQIVFVSIVYVYLIAAVAFISAFIYRILCRNLFVRSLVLPGAVEFDTALNPWVYLWITVSNLVATVLSLGLLQPWAKVRARRYLAETLAVQVIGDMDGFIDSSRAANAAFGEELVEFAGYELTL